MTPSVSCGLFFLFHFKETPTSDFGSNGDITPSDASTPGTPHVPFQPKFKVKVTEPTKDGDVVHYTIKTIVSQPSYVIH